MDPDKTTKQIVTEITILLICVFGLLGNSLCLLVIFKKKLLSPFYILLIGLTFSDSLLLIMSAIRTSHQLHIIDLNNSPVYLEIIFFFLDWLSTSGTKYFTVAVSLERYFVICHPMKAQRVITKRRGVAFGVAVLAFVVLLTIWSYFYQKIDASSFEIYTAIILHLIPFVLVLALNGMLYFGLRKFQKERRSLTAGESTEVSITKMLLALVVVFGFCYSFEFIRRFMAYADYFDFEKFRWYDYTINCLAGIFYVLNSAVNFIIYCLTGDTFFREFLDVFGFLKKFQLWKISPSPAKSPTPAKYPVLARNPAAAQTKNPV